MTAEQQLDQGKGKEEKKGKKTFNTSISLMSPVKPMIASPIRSIGRSLLHLESNYKLTHSLSFVLRWLYEKMSKRDVRRNQI